MELCRFFLQSRCSKGASCRYRHELPPTIPSLNSATPNNSISRPSKPCYYFLKGICRKGNTCPFSHEAVPDDSTAANESLITCKHFKRGNCLRGTDCPYDHPVTSEVGEPNADSEHDSFYRELSGNLVQFGDGATVTDFSMASDFSAVKLVRLPRTSTVAEVCRLVEEFGHPISPKNVFVSSDQDGATAHISATDSAFAKTFCRDLAASQNPSYSNLHAVVTTPRLPTWAASRRISCRKVVIAWQQPTRTVWLRWMSGDPRASLANNGFKEGFFTICGQRVSAYPPQDNGTLTTVMLRKVPYNVGEQDVRDAITYGWAQPLIVQLEDASQHETVSAATEMVESLLRNIGPLDFALVTGPHRRHAKAVANFADEASAREAIRTLHDQPQPFLKDKSLSLQLLVSSTTRVPQKIYDAVEDQLAACVPAWTEQGLCYKVCADPISRKRFVTLKIEGADQKDVAKATNELDYITTGRVIKDEAGVDFWTASLMSNGPAARTLEQIQQTRGVLIIRHKPKRQLQYYGPPELFSEVRAAVIAQLKIPPPTAHHYMALTAQQFSWLCQGGLKQLSVAVRPATVSLDVKTQPRVLVLLGSETQFSDAKCFLSLQCPAESTLATAPNDCFICLSDLDDPVTLGCNHKCCQECFQGLCAAGGPASFDFLVKCTADGDTCGRVVTLPDMKAALPSSVFESILKASFVRYTQRRPDKFRPCPTPDCGSIFRASHDDRRSSRSLTCPKCFSTVCSACFELHDGNISCEEYKDLSTGGHGAFENYKRSHNVKDCPRCTSSIEKTEGCNHMQCSGCRAHICWECLETFDQSDRCYTHMNTAHGGIGLHDEMVDD